MDFKMQADLPASPVKVWPMLIDIGEMTACIPGVEDVEEKDKLRLYRAVLKQKVGPFKLEVPAEIFVDEFRQPDFVHARAVGKDKLTGTTLSVNFNVVLEPHNGSGSRLTVEASLTVAGRLASLGHAMIKKKAEENFVEFENRFRSRLEAI